MRSLRLHMRSRPQPQQPSRRWCQRHGLEEQRLYEALKLKRQFESILVENRLVSPEANPTLFERRRAREGGSGPAPRDRRGRIMLELDRAADAEYQAKQALMERARRAQAGRKRRLLALDEAGVATTEQLTDDAAPSGDVRDANQRGAANAVDLANLDVRDLDFQLSYDIEALQQDVAAHRQFSRLEIDLIKLIICSGATERSPRARARNVPQPNAGGRRGTPMRYGMASACKACIPISRSPTKATCTGAPPSTRFTPRSSAVCSCTQPASSRTSRN